jgi:SAM-dependent methyltransferase
MTARKIERLSARAGYDLWSKTYDSTPNPVVAMDSRHTIKLLSPQRGEAILDAGCGTGRNLKEMLLAGSLPTGVDFSNGMLKIARQNYPSVPIALADLERPLPFQDESFDAVLCSLIGEHLSALCGVVQEFHRALKRGGRLVFSVYHPEMSAAGIEANFEQEGIEYRLGAFHYTVQEHVDLFESTGFANIVVKEFEGDETLVSSLPSTAKYLGFPVLLVLMANR